jgi:hypothetical protein
MRGDEEVFLYCSLDTVAVRFVMDKNSFIVATVFLLGHLTAITALDINP